jgi:hypothetical protein
MRLAVLVGTRVDSRQAAQRVSETHGCIAGVFGVYKQHISTVSRGPTTRYVAPQKEDLGGRQVLVETAVTAMHFGWCLPPLRRRERYAHFPSRNIVLP